MCKERYKGMEMSGTINTIQVVGVGIVRAEAECEKEGR